MTIVRPVLALGAGVLVMVVTVALVELIGHLFFPLPREVVEASVEHVRSVGTGDPIRISEARLARNEAVGRYLHAAPIGATLFVVAAWVAGAAVGGATAALTVRSRPRAFAVAVGLVDAVGILHATVSEIDHPLWMPIVGIVASLGASGLVGTIVARRRPGGEKSLE